MVAFRRSDVNTRDLDRTYVGRLAELATEDPDWLHELIDVFEDDTTTQVGKIVAASSPEELCSVLVRVRGAALCLGATRLAQLCALLCARWRRRAPGKFEVGEARARLFEAARMATRSLRRGGPLPT